MENLKSLIQSFVKLQGGKNVLLFRSAESLGNFSGTICGWTDAKLTVSGREQANKLYPHLKPYIHQFSGIYVSDLVRSIDTASISLGFPDTSLFKVDPRLREMHFGVDEGLHFDSQPQFKKDEINSLEYAPQRGETWPKTKERCIKFFKKLPDGNYLVYTHGGLMCTLSYQFGLQDILPNCSCIGFNLSGDTGEPNKLLFSWEFPPKEFDELLAQSQPKL